MSGISLETEIHTCTNCGEQAVMLIIEDPKKLTIDQAKILGKKGIQVIKLGDKFKCPKCGHEVIAQ